MKIVNQSNNIAILDIGKTHAKVILFDANEMEELVVYQKKNQNHYRNHSNCDQRCSNSLKSIRMLGVHNALMSHSSCAQRRVQSNCDERAPERQLSGAFSVTTHVLL